MGMPATIADEHRDLIIDRLSQLSSLRLPGQGTYPDKSTTVEKRSIYLRNLITHDPGVFLERHGDHLRTVELEYFSCLRSSSYEVDFYMKLLEDKAAYEAAGTRGVAPLNSRATKKIAAAAKNRRLAKLEVLEKEGYFKMEAMRSREPYLYHIYIGQYTSGASSPVEEENNADAKEEKEKIAEEKASAPIETEAVRSATAQLAGNIMDQHDELELLLRREAEREAYALQEQENESEEEEEDEEAVTAPRPSDRNEANIPGEWPAPEALTHEQR
jgi:hypothetical protein